MYVWLELEGGMVSLERATDASGINELHDTRTLISTAA